MTVQFIELANSPVLSITSELGATATRIFRCAWEDRLELASDLTGGWTTVGEMNFLKQPMVFPSLRDLTVDSVQIAPDLPDSPKGDTPVSMTQGQNRYTYARLTVQYKIREVQAGRDLTNDPPEMLPGTSMSIKSDFGAEFLTTAGRQWTWKDQIKYLGADMTPGKLISTIEHSVTWHMAPRYPSSVITGLVGKVNSGKFLDVEKDRLLFRGASTAVEIKWADQRQTTQWTITYQFSERPTGSPSWQELWNEETKAWDTPLLGGDLINGWMYNSGDFSPLFK